MQNVVYALYRLVQRSIDALAKLEFAFNSCFVFLCSQKFKLEWMGDNLSGHAGFPCEKGYLALGVNHKDLFGREACLLPALAWKTERA